MSTSWLRRRALEAARTSIDNRLAQRCDADDLSTIADAIDQVAREFAARALAEYAGRARLVAGGHSVAKLNRHISEAIAEADKDDTP